MRRLLLTLLFSFCPKSVRRHHDHLDPTALLRIATLTGLFQMVAAAWLLGHRFIVFFLVQKQQWAYSLGGESDQVHVGSAFLILAAYLLHPLSLILAYLAIEGFLRFISSILVHEVVPSLPVALFFVLRTKLTSGHKAIPPDSVDVRTSGRLLIITSSMPKQQWNSDLIIGVKRAGVLQGWYELRDSGEQRDFGRYVYILYSIPVPRLTARPYAEYNLPPERDLAGSEAQPPQPEHNHR